MFQPKLQKMFKKPAKLPEVYLPSKLSPATKEHQPKAFSFHSPLTNPPLEEFPINLTLENFYHPTANSLRPVHK